MEIAPTPKKWTRFMAAWLGFCAKRTLLMKYASVTTVDRDHATIKMK